MIITSAYIEACLEELNAPKPGNVHIHAAGHRMTVADFTRSAEVSAPLLCRFGARLGERIRDATAATWQAVGQNTNLGILLLCGPLAMAAEHGETPAAVIAASDLEDAQAVFEAIRLAQPGGLGSADRHDVHQPATVTLAAAMAEAADRDSIARQWTNGFADILGPTLTSYAAARLRWPDPSWATLTAFLEFLATCPDSHIQRKHGPAIATSVQHKANSVRDALAACTNPATMLPELLAWDHVLKVKGINPGTSADLTVATAFAWRLGLRFT
ncbi:triphosphoribosyl-dephospho-CoA synthase [Acidisphaera sp. S103]|uniref:triphosphoribosyl-dephospho-CoA synthase n=1 Tax=Acidisphaera sp. S103 TaxID=1747223 RepID=UPI00131C4A2D|nr:triphosphoribosyl-dephospho-CoA synthase [Acidisphaera sp. S103]